ncbi:hypothetical protein D3C86_1929120 [compost metagenome]
MTVIASQIRNPVFKVRNFFVITSSNTVEKLKFYFLCHESVFGINYHLSNACKFAVKLQNPLLSILLIGGDNISENGTVKFLSIIA